MKEVTLSQTSCRRTIYSVIFPNSEKWQSEIHFWGLKELTKSIKILNIKVSYIHLGVLKEKFTCNFESNNRDKAVNLLIVVVWNSIPKTILGFDFPLTGILVSSFFLLNLLFYFYYSLSNKIFFLICQIKSG